MKDTFCEICPTYERAQDDGTVCGADDCNNLQIVMFDGTCWDCPSYTRSSTDKR